jgi:anti-sigma B factor antagonist
VTTSEPASLDIAVEVDGARTVVTLVGEIDAYTADRLQGAFTDLGDVAGRHVVVDLAGVGFVDSAGLATLVQAFRRIRDGGGALSMRAVTPQLVKLFEITGLDRLFPTA